MSLIKGAYHTEKTAFINNLQAEKTSEKLNGILQNTEAQDDFWNLCKSYAEIGLNAPKYRTPGTCEVKGAFQYADIDNARDKAVEFIQKYNIADTDAFFDLVEKMYIHAVEFDDNRHGGLVKPESTSMSGFAGKYYNFAEMPDDVFEGLKKNSLDKLNI